jgi:hypothetical protein
VAKMIRFVVAAFIMISSAGVLAQSTEAGGQASAASQKAQTAVKVQLVLSRYQGDKKLSSVPYALTAIADTREVTLLRMGVQMPIPTGDGKGYNYKDVGTNIDCAVVPSVDGVFKVSLKVTDSSISFADDKSRQTASPVVAPTFRNFTSSFTILLRDGQTTQYTSVTDPVSGEVLKIDATLNVLK